MDETRKNSPLKSGKNKIKTKNGERKMEKGRIWKLRKNISKCIWSDKTGKMMQKDSRTID